MIKVAGSAKLSFLFPANRVTTYTYFSNMHRLVQHLPYIDLVSASENNEFRLSFQSTELGTYHIHALCDVRMDLVSGHHTIRILPIENLPPIETKSTLNSTSARGFYSSEAYFRDEGEQTRIEYHLKLRANLPRPLGMRLMPGKLADKIAQSITQRRLHDIANDFIRNSIDAFPAWLAQSTGQTSAPGASTLSQVPGA